MGSRYKNGVTATTLFLIGVLVQVYVVVSFAAPTSSVSTPVAQAQGIAAILTTSGNKPISINGANTATGATVLSGALVETPAGVRATINIPGHATLEVAPNTSVVVEFDQNGNAKVTLREGSVKLHTKKGTTGEIDTSQGVAGKTDPTRDDVLRVSFSRGAAAPTVDTGSDVGAGGGGGPGALSPIAGIVIISSLTAAGIAASLRGHNPSPASR